MSILADAPAPRRAALAEAEPPGAPACFNGIALGHHRTMPMKYLAPGVAAAALLALVAAAAAQTYTPMGPQMMSPPTPYLPTYMIDDGSSSDFPTHTPSDYGADRLNRQINQMNEGARMMAVPYPPGAR
jgi:hypothetical protein